MLSQKTIDEITKQEQKMKTIHIHMVGPTRRDPRDTIVGREFEAV